MSAALMQNRHAQAAYSMARPRRRTDGNCFCGQSGTALLFGMLSGYLTLLCTGLHFVTSSIGEVQQDDVNIVAGTHQEIHHNHHEQQDTRESMLPVVFVMAISTAFGFLGPLHDNPFHQSGRALTTLSLGALLLYGLLFWAYEVESLLGLISSARVVSLALHPLQGLVKSCSPCVWVYQVCFLRCRRHVTAQGSASSRQQYDQREEQHEQELVYRKEDEMGGAAGAGAGAASTGDKFNV